MKRIIAGIIMLMTAGSLQAQDPNFSQFFVSPLTLNPALTGKFEGDWRVAGNYRDQWPSISRAFITSTVSVDMNILQGKIPEFDRLGIGLMAMTDKTANGILNNNYLALSSAYHKSLDENGYHQLGLGFQACYGSKRLDGTKLNFAEELDQLGGWTAPTAEPLNDRQVSVRYFDASTGILYNGTTDGLNNFYAGISVYHITEPKEGFSGNGKYELGQRYTIHGGGMLPLSETTELHVSLLHSRQVKAVNTVMGGAFAFLLGDAGVNAPKLYLGSWFRYGDALIPYLGIEMNNLRIGTSYDLNASGLRTASQGKGGIELSIIYISRKRERSNVIKCPTF